MDIENKIKYIAALRHEIAANAKILKEAEQDIAEYLCPFKVGDKITTEEGYAVIISSIKHSSFKEGFDLEVYKIKKDGSKYKFTNTLWGDLSRYKLAT